MPGLSYLPIAALVVVLPIPLAVSRLLAARHDRLELGLLRHPLLANLLPHRLQLLNVLLLCGLLAFTLGTGAYDRVAFGFSQGAYRAFLVRLSRRPGGIAADCGGSAEARARGLQSAGSW